MLLLYWKSLVRPHAVYHALDDANGVVCILDQDFQKLFDATRLQAKLGCFDEQLPPCGRQLGTALPMNYNLM
jgi:hypothetical protein